ncbi:TlpA disulfide reductase family protein [Rhizosphaericola mali]|nr:TlpA disulfide reductase family protein [Rhizosphaericola mali]
MNNRFSCKYLNVIFTSIFISVIFTQVDAQKAFTYHLSGTFPDIKKAYIDHTGPQGWKTDSVFLKDGKFEFTDTAREVSVASVELLRRDDGRIFNGGSIQFNVFQEPGNISLSYYDHNKEVSVTGTPNNDISTKFNKGNEDYENAIRPIYDSLNTYHYKAFLLRKDTINNNADSIAYFEKEARHYDSLAHPWTLKFYHSLMNAIYANPKSYFTAHYTKGWIDEISQDSVKEIYNNLGPEIQNSTMGKDILNSLNSSNVATTGTKAPLFEDDADINGKKLALADYKGKYVLLDFWASWCSPCREGNPHMIEQYNKYHSKGLEIIGISDDDNNIGAWKNAVKKDNIGIWKHILRRAGKMDAKGNDKDVSKLYNVSAYPTKILIDPNGIIVDRFMDDKKLDNQLESIFSK